MKPRRTFLVIAVALAAALATSSCGGSSETNAATVDGRNIDRAGFERELQALVDNKELQAASGGGSTLAGSGKKTVDARVTAGWLTATIYDALITNEFEERKLSIGPSDREAASAQLANQFGNPNVAKEFPKWFRDLLVERNARAVAVRSALSGVDFSEAGLKKYYEAHTNDFGQTCLSHILAKTEAEAAAALTRIKGGEDFAAVAKEVSTDPGSGSKGGDLGCNPKGVFVPEFDKAANELPLNTVSELVKTDFGFHILLVRERRTQTFEEAKEETTAALNAQGQDAFRTFLDKAARSATVTVDKRYGKFESSPDSAPQVVPPEVPAPATSRPQGGTPGEDTSTPPSSGG